MPKLRIAVVIPTQSSLTSSLQNLLKLYLYLIRKHKAEVTLFTDSENDFSYKNFNIQKIKGFDYRTPIEKALFLLGLPRFYYFDLAEKLKGYDVIESSNPEFYMFAYQAYLAAKKHNIRLVYRTSQTVEGFFLFKYTKFIALHFARRACKYAKYLLFSNPEAEKRYISLGLLERGSEKGIVIGHPTDTKCFMPLNVKMPKRQVVLSVGGLYKLKGHDIIIKSVKSLVDKGYDIELWIVGEGHYKHKLEGLVDSLGIKNRVKFLGAKSHKELALVYNQASVFALANLQEITPAVNEALACKVPVVVMDCGGTDFVVRNRNLGIIARRLDIEDMARGIERILTDKEYAKKIGENGRKFIVGNFSVERVAEKVYKSFVN